MISLKIDSKQFQKDLKNIIDYSVGFLDGVEIGKKEFYNSLGPTITDQAAQFIDMNARADYNSLHHVYEWYQTGSPQNRLFDISFSVNSNGLSFSSNFSQSQTVQQGSTTPFYNKAQIMESGQAVIIKPRKADALRFEVGGEVVYTKKPVLVENPGGNTQGQFANVFDMFFNKYFSQAFLRSSGLLKHFSNPSVYKNNLNSGKRGGRSVGLAIGSKWVASAGKVTV